MGYRKNMQKRIWMMAVVLFVVMVGCRDQIEAPPGDVLAKVNGIPVTASDFEQAALKAYGDNYQEELPPHTRKALIESLVLAKAIAQAAEQSLTPEENALIQARARGYKEELLIQKYLKDKVRVDPVTQEQVRDYYQNHLEAFGKRKKIFYEMAISRNPVGFSERPSYLKAFDRAPEKDWQAWADQLTAQGVPAEHKKGVYENQRFTKTLSTLLLSLNEKEVSGPVFIDSRLYRVKVDRIEQVEPQPLNAVASEIRRKLAPMAVKNALEKVKADLLHQAEITYMDN